MTTNVRIGRIVLEGFELSRRERDALGPAIAHELRRLAGPPPGVPDARHDETQRRGPGSAVDGIAREVAAAVHRATAAAQPAPGPLTGPAAGPAPRRRRG